MNNQKEIDNQILSAKETDNKMFPLEITIPGIITYKSENSEKGNGSRLIIILGFMLIALAMLGMFIIYWNPKPETLAWIGALLGIKKGVGTLLKKVRSP